MASCVRCRADNPPDARFCMACGAGMGLTCDTCARSLPAEALFCINCGTPVAQRAGDGSETIKLVTILFADVVGSTAQAEIMRPEDTRALMARLFDAMSEEIRAEGGTVERIIGDAIMADFGVPIAREDDPVRAVRAARRMLSRLDGFNEARPDERPVEIRIGINTGAVSTGGSFGEQLLVMGDAVNVAARLEQAAPPGTILIGEKTARAVRGRFRLERAESVVAKGKTHPVQAFAVQEEVDGGEETALRRAPLVGRQSELHLLRDLFDRCRDAPTQQVCMVIGDAGIGKSRLLSEFIGAVEEEEVNVLLGRCPPYGDGLTLAPLQEILRSEAGIFPRDESETSLAKVARLLSGAAPELPPAEAISTAAALGSTIGLSPALDSMADLDPRMVYREMLRAWRVLLSGLARLGPVVLVVEDIHWADRTMLDVFADLSRNIDGPALLICSAREEFMIARSEWLSMLPGYSTIHLDALEGTAAEALVGKLLGTSDLPLELTERVLERAEGNPLFIEEFLLRLVDAGCLAEGTDGWFVTGDVSDIEVPERVQTLIQARLDLLSPLEREVLQAGAVIGRYFWSGALQWVTGIPDASDVIDRLKPRQMVVEQFSSAIPGEIEYAFRHSLIRDVVYETIPRKSRARAHKATARWIESIRGDRADEAAELLAEHYERAYEHGQEEELRSSARRYLLLAARAALRRFAIDQAERLGFGAVELSLAGEEKAAALEALGDAYHLAMRGNAAWNAYTSAMDELGVASDTVNGSYARVAAKAATVATRWVGTMDQHVPLDEIERVIEQGLDWVGTSDSRERVLLLSARGFLAGTAGSVSEPIQASAENAAREALDIARRLDDPDLLSGTMDAMSVRLWPSGRFGEIVQIDRERLQLLPELSDVREIADILLSAGRDLTRVGKYREALGYLDQAADVVRAIDPGQYLHTLVHRSATRCSLGMWDDALQDVAEIERLENLEDADAAPPYAVRAFGVAYFCHQLRGATEAAERYLSILRAYVQNLDHVGPDARDPLALPARALARAGHVSEALSWLSFERWSGLSEHLEAGCDVVVRSMEDDAPAVLAKARREVDYAGVRALEYHADRLEAQLFLRSGQPTSAIDLFLRSADGFARVEASWEEACSRLLAGSALAAAGESRSAGAQFALALPVFERLGSLEELEACRERAPSLNL